MILIRKEIKNNLILFILAILYIILLIMVLGNNWYSDYYNKIFKYRNNNILSLEYLSLIIATVTGDQNALNSKIKILYADLQIKHLLVLSGSNLLIFHRFIYFRKYIFKLSYFLTYYFILFSYLFFVDFLHPITRAFIFMLIQDFIMSLGFKVPYLIKIYALLIITVILYYLLDYSNSFLLSAIYYFLITIYMVNSPKSTILNKLLFPFYMTIASIPIHYFFFGEINLRSLLLSNLLIVPIYDIFVFIMYLTYIIGFYPYHINPLLILSQYLYDYFFRYLEFINNINQYIINL